LEPDIALESRYSDIPQADQLASSLFLLGKGVKFGPVRRNQDYVSMNFEQWQQRSALACKEQDPAKLTGLAKELNVVLNQKTQTLDSPPCKPSE
jgi:hypothetical protein